MTAGYVRQSNANIQPNLNINSADLNAEFNQLQSAFDNTAGHDHSGSVSGDGAKINLATSVTGVLPAANGGTGGSSVPIVNSNKIINPFLQIDQVNEGASVSVPHSASQVYIVDGFTLANNNGNPATGMTGQQSSDAPAGFPTSLAATMGASGSIGSGSIVAINTNIEANDISDTQFGTANANTICLTFWAKSTVSGTYCASIINAAGTRSYIFNFALTANIWTKTSAVIPGDVTGTWPVSGASLGLSVSIVLGCGSSLQGTANTWQTGALYATSSITTSFVTTNAAVFKLGPTKLEVSQSPTVLFRTSIFDELARCQRYYEKSWDWGTAVGTNTAAGQFATQLNNLSSATYTIGGFIPYKVAKRSTPLVTLYSNSGASGKIRDVANSADVTAAYGSPTGLGGFQWQATANASNTQYYMSGHWTSDARL